MNPGTAAAPLVPLSSSGSNGLDSGPPREAAGSGCCTRSAPPLSVWRTSIAPPHRPIAFGIAWFCLALLPASSVFPLAEVTNDHRAFFGYVGLSLSVVCGLALLFMHWSETAPDLRRVIFGSAVALAVVAVGGNAIGTYERNKVFLTDASLWRDVAEKSPANGRGLMQMALARYARPRRSSTGPPLSLRTTPRSRSIWAS